MTEIPEYTVRLQYWTKDFRQVSITEGDIKRMVEATETIEMMNRAIAVAKQLAALK